MQSSRWILIALVCVSTLFLPAVESFSYYQCTTTDPVKLVSNGMSYPTIQAAYTAAAGNDTIMLAADYFNESLLLDSAKTVSFDGGYDCDFQANPFSTIIQSLAIADGSVSPSNIVLSSVMPMCQPGEPNNFPGNYETCDCTDNNCNGLIDDGLTFDNDGDGYSAFGSCGGSGNDCDDNDPSVHPYGEILGDGIDQDCNGVDLIPATQEHPDAAGGSPCSDCHSWTLINYQAHNSTNAPDATCVGCHAPQVNTLLPGHYGMTVKTTNTYGNTTITAGTTITCAICHVPWNDSTQGHTDTNDVWALVDATWNGSQYVNLTCDTCHLTRAAEHATDTAHDFRVIDSACSQCHTSDTSVLGSPGNGTLETQADVDALHQNNCALCHAYTGSNVCPQTVEQTIEDGMNGIQVSCTDCHSAHHSPETNQVSFDPLIDTSQPSQEGCDICHHDYDIVNGTSLGLSTWATILVEHDLDGAKDGSSSACANCHAYDGSSTPPLADVQNAIASGGPATCASCHTDKVPDATHGSPESGKHAEHLAMAGIFGCSTCHASAPYFQSGIDANSDGLYDLSETDVCNPCHQDWDSGGLPTERDYKAGWYIEEFTLDCIYCHAELVNNGDNTPPGGRRAVSGEFPVAETHAHYGSDLDAASCQICHDHTDHAFGTIDLIDPDGGAGYSFIYPTDLSSDPDLSNFCSNCHDADGATRLLAPLDPMDPFGNGNAAPDVASRFMGDLQWNEYYGDGCFGNEGSLRPVNSHHDISDTDQAFSGAKIECLDCHGAHTSAASQKLTDPFTDNLAWTGTLNEFCLSCHNGEHGPDDLTLPSEVAVPLFYTPPPANIPGESCGAGMVYDCAGDCVAQLDINSALTNGICDNLGSPNLDCTMFNFDNGDCLPPYTPNTSCDTDMVYDCAGNCVAQTDVDTALANSTCDEAIDLDLNCAEFFYDAYVCNPCEGNDCSYVGGIDSCYFYKAPWWIQMTWSNEAHGGGSKRQWGGYSGAPAVPAMDCIVCHDSHGSYDATTNTAGNPYMLRDYIDGTQFIDDGVRPGAQWTGPPWDTTGTAGSVTIKDFDGISIGTQLGDELCVKCHANWTAAYDWHSYCTGCLTCHSHGQAWGAQDLGSQGLDDAVWCPEQ